MASFLVRLADAADDLDTGTAVRALPQPPRAGSATCLQAASTPRTSGAWRQPASCRAARRAARPTSTARAVGDRAQMASFVARTLSYVRGSELTAREDYFVDDESCSVPRAEHQRPGQGGRGRG
jgi:hypothetical protein